MNETQWQETMNSHVAEEKNKRFFFLSSYAQASDCLKKMAALYVWWIIFKTFFEIAQ